VNWYKKAQSKMMLGYKVMRVENGELVSGANSRLTLPMQIGAIHDMPGHGIYMGKSPEYVKDYYSSSEDLDDPKEVLITYQFSVDDVIHGNLEDREWEISVPTARVLNIEAIN
jgi:hypothetical protein